MPARAFRAAADTRGNQQAEGERENGVQESEGGLGQTTQWTREGDQQATEGAEAQLWTDERLGEEAGGDAPARKIMRNNHKILIKLEILSIRRSRTWLNYWPSRRVHYWKPVRKAEFESESWRRTSKHWLKGLWTERQRWKGRSLFGFIFHLCACVSEMLKCVCRMKERAKRAGAQRKEEEDERSALQVIMVHNLLRLIVPLLYFSFSLILFCPSV